MKLYSIYSNVKQKNQLKGRKDVNELEGNLLSLQLKDVDCLLLTIYLILIVSLPIYRSTRILNCWKKDEVNSYALHIKVCVPCIDIPSLYFPTYTN